MTTIEQSQKSLELHMRGHELEAPVLPAPPQPQHQQQNRILKGVTPNLEAHITNQEWIYLKGKWGRYKNYCNLIQERVKVHNLWECLSDELIRAAMDDGFEDGSVVIEAVFLDHIKKLTVKTQNTLVGQVQFLNLGQDRGEEINSYVLRLHGAAVGCKFEVQSPCECQRTMSYTYKIILH